MMMITLPSKRPVSMLNTVGPCNLVKMLTTVFGIKELYIGDLLSVDKLSVSGVWVFKTCFKLNEAPYVQVLFSFLTKALIEASR